MKAKFKSIFLTAIFIVIIGFPILNNSLKLVKDIKSTENRKMTAKPILNVNLLDPFPNEYEKYYNDNFRIRSLMIKYYNLINLTLFKKSPVPDKVIIGNDGWLFMANDEIDCYSGKHRFDQSELEAFKMELEYRKKYINERKGSFYFIIVPEKATIYPEKVPSRIFRYTKQSWGEQLIDYLNKNSIVNTINFYDVLKNNKKEELIYYKLDNHWNHLGAFIACNEILQHLKKENGNLISTLPITNFNVKKIHKNTGNIISMLSNMGNFTDDDFEIVPKKGFKATDAPKSNYVPDKDFPYPWDYENVKAIKGSDKPKILIITDSFGGYLYPYISEEFSRSVKIWDSWQYKLNEDILNKEKPDIVLLMVYEPHLRNILKNQSRLTRK